MKKGTERQKSSQSKQMVRNASQEKKKFYQTTKPVVSKRESKSEQSDTSTPGKNATEKTKQESQVKEKRFTSISSMSIEPERCKTPSKQQQSRVETTTQRVENEQQVTTLESKPHTEQIKQSQSQGQEESTPANYQMERQTEKNQVNDDCSEKHKIEPQDLQERKEALQMEESSLHEVDLSSVKEITQEIVQETKVEHQLGVNRKERVARSSQKIEEVQFEQVPEEIDPPSPPAKEVKQEIKVDTQELIPEQTHRIKESGKRKKLESSTAERQEKKEKREEQRVPEILKLIQRTQALSSENKTQLQQLSQIQKSRIQVEYPEVEYSATTVKRGSEKKGEKEEKQQQSSSEEQKQQQFQEKIAKYLKEQEILKSNAQEEKKKEPEQKKKGGPKVKSKIASIHKALQDPNIVDYSKHYKCFNEIFSCFQSSLKNFDAPVLYRDTRNMYQNFIALMDSSCLFFNKHQFEMDPLSQAQQKNMMFANHLLMAQKNFSDRELEMKNSDNELMMMAMQQAQIQQKYKQLKVSPDSNINPLQTPENQTLIVPNRNATLYFRVIKNKAEVYEIITMAFHRKKRWNELPHGVDLRHSWNLLWSWSKSKIDHNKLLAWQRINHFQQSKNVSRKDFLKKNIERVQKMSSKCGAVFNIMPATFVLPKEYVNFVQEYTRYSQFEGEYNFWIVKPCAMSRGRGISLINDISVSYVDPVIVQKYVRNPLLLNGFKFDLRIYVVVTSVNPLQVFIYKEGFARFSTKPYSISPEDIKNKFIHLTNSSVNKNNNYSELDQTDQLYGGTKIDLKTLRDRLQSKKISWDKIWTQVCEIVVKSFVACQTDIPYNPSCFELFGYDIIIDDNLKCWLIEINSSPSLGRMNLLDDMVKQRLIDDTIDLIECVDFDRKRLVEVLERRIAEEGRATGPTFGGLKQMNRDLTYILNGTVPRKYGEMPRFLGNFQRIAPTPYSDKVIRLVGGQKMFGSQSKVLEKIERSDSKMSLGG